MIPSASTSSRAAIVRIVATNPSSGAPVRSVTLELTEPVGTATPDVPADNFPTADVKTSGSGAPPQPEEKS